MAEETDGVVTTAKRTGTNTYVEVVPLTLHIGAEIRGVDLSKPLPPQQLKEVRDAFLKWKVVFFRGQHLDHAQHVAMARQFGEPTIGHAVFGHVEGYPEIYSVAKNRTANENREAMMVTPWSGWHTDITAAVNPPFASILRGVTIPPYGGDTFWTNLAAAYHGLSPTMRGFVDGLRGHSQVRAARKPEGRAANTTKASSAAPLASEHPLVTVHAETGERVLFASPSFLKSIVGLTPRESQKLLELFWEHVTRPEYTVRFKWNAGRHRVLGQPLDLAPGADRHLPVRFRSPALSDHAGRTAARRCRWPALQSHRGAADPVRGGGAADDGGSGIAAFVT